MEHLSGKSTNLMTLPVHLLDVGARKSLYTIGLNAEVTMLDVWRDAPLQDQLNLGVTNEMLAQVSRRRSNVKGYWVKDFLKTDLPENSFDLVTSIEVIEHISKDVRFIQQVSKVLRSGGLLYLTTPNGENIPNENPDHVRHYTAKELETLLLTAFPQAIVECGEVITASRNRGLHPWKRDPVALIANLFNHIENRLIKVTPNNSARLYATAQKI